MHEWHIGCSNLEQAPVRHLICTKDGTMRRLLTLAACSAVFCAMALAESFTGKLVDSSCYDQKKSTASCAPTSSTTSFALEASGTVYKFDDAGNAKAQDA